MIRSMNLHRLLLTSLLFAACSTAAASECVPKIRDGWLRLPPIDMPMLAGFGRIENACSKPVTIVGVSSSAFADTSLHETRIVEGVSRMRSMAELRIAPGDAAVLKPGGLHLMLMKPHTPLKAGSKVAVSFQLKGGGELLGEFVVRRPGE